MYNKEGSPFAVPSFNNLPLDQVALEILYSSNSKLVNNDLMNKYLTTNNNSVEELCIEQKYEIVLFEDNDYVCDIELTQSPCYATIEFVNNQSVSADIWCDLKASECGYYSFEDFNETFLLTTEFINLLLLAAFLIIVRKIYITKRKSKIQYVEINENEEFMMNLILINIIC